MAGADALVSTLVLLSLLSPLRLFPLAANPVSVLCTALHTTLRTPRYVAVLPYHPYPPVLYQAQQSVSCARARARNRVSCLASPLTGLIREAEAKGRNFSLTDRD